MLTPMSNVAIVLLLNAPPSNGKPVKWTIQSKGLSPIDAAMLNLLLDKEMKSIDGFLELKKHDLLKVRVVSSVEKKYFLLFNSKESEVVVFVVSDLNTIEDVEEDRIINRAFGALSNKVWGLTHIRRGRRYESQGGLGTYEDLRSAISTGATQVDVGLVKIQK